MHAPAEGDEQFEIGLDHVLAAIDPAGSVL